LKRFTGWAIASNRSPERQIFKSLRLYLLLSYLTVMIAILGAFGVAVYVFFSRSLDHQLDQQLLTLAQAAVPSLDIVKNKKLPKLTQNSPWRDLFTRDRRLEWFDADGKLLAKQGNIFANSPLNKGSQNIQQIKQVRTLTIPVYSGTNEKILQLKGYIRASESTKQAETVLNKLLWGLGSGGTIALVFITIGGTWLTQQALEPVEQSFQRLKQFTANASHELRNPLTVINTAVEVMQSHPERIHPMDTKKLVAISSANDQLTRLAEDLLFLAKKDAVAIQPVADRTSVVSDKLLQDVVARLKFQAEVKAITITSNLLTNIAVRGEATQLHRLFFNLLENALKYSPPGGEICLSMLVHRHVAIVRVEDNGMGIAPENLPFIFQRFWRSDAARSRQIKGSGLGLAIAQAIAEQYQGKIEVTSQLGKGSCFLVYLHRA
jgi:two-component system, OmpR family, manganese sensing sensor histidine kinase